MTIQEYGLKFKQLDRQGQGGGNCRTQSTASSAPASHPIQQGNSCGTGGCQRQNILYSLQVRQDQEGSPNVVIEVQFIVSPETPSELFSVATPVSDPVITRKKEKEKKEMEEKDKEKKEKEEKEKEKESKQKDKDKDKEKGKQNEKEDNEKEKENQKEKAKAKMNEKKVEVVICDVK
nr:101 kDa malaria antigen-like [Solanum lycopersicum]